MSHESQITPKLSSEAAAVESLLRQFAVALPGQELTNQRTADSAGNLLDRDRLMYLAGFAAAEAKQQVATVSLKPQTKSAWYWPVATLASSSLAALFLGLLISASSSQPALPLAKVSDKPLVIKTPASDLEVPSKTTEVLHVDPQQLQRQERERRQAENNAARRIAALPMNSSLRSRDMALTWGVDSLSPTVSRQISSPMTTSVETSSPPATVRPLTPFGHLEDVLGSAGAL